MNLKRIDAALAAYRRNLDEKDLARLEFFRTLWEVEAAVAADASDFELPAAKRLRELHDAQEPVFSAVPVAIDASAFVDAVERLCACAAEQDVFSSEVVAAFERVKWDRVIAASPLSDAGKDPGAYLDELAQILLDDGMSEDEALCALLLVSLALRSQISAAAEKAADSLVKAGAQEPHSVCCPVCGGHAAAARVGGENSTQGRGKTLWCPQCGTTWEFERVRCARCGTQNQSHLHYFNVEGDEAHRIATCDECGEYVRTVYADDGLAPFSFEVEDVVMARLDAIADDPSFAGSASA